MGQLGGEAMDDWQAGPTPIGVWRVDWGQGLPWEGALGGGPTGPTPNLWGGQSGAELAGRRGLGPIRVGVMIGGEGLWIVG